MATLDETVEMRGAAILSLRLKCSQWRLKRLYVPGVGRGREGSGLTLLLSREKEKAKESSSRDSDRNRVTSELGDERGRDDVFVISSVQILCEGTQVISTRILSKKRKHSHVNG